MARERRGRPIDPVEVGREASAAGLHVVERVAEEMGAILRPTERKPAPTAERPNLMDGIAEIVAEALDRAGEVAQDLGALIGERDWTGAGGTARRCVRVAGVPGEDAVEDFSVTNTGTVALREVSLVATELLGASGRVGAEAIRFSPQPVKRIGPGAAVDVRVTVAIPSDALEGVYRGVVQAQSKPQAGRGDAEAGPQDAWAVLELAVEAAEPRRT